MTRAALVLCLSLLTAPAALAAPLTLQALKLMLTQHEGEALEMDLEDGRPLITGEMQEQVFEALLTDCRGPEPSCEAVRFSACHDLTDHSRTEALEIANDWNTGERPGVLYASEEWFGQALCVKLRQAFPGEMTFGADQIAIWQIELGDFLQRIEDAVAEKQAANALDSGAD